jgi:hypothetical protein
MSRTKKEPALSWPESPLHDAPHLRIGAATMTMRLTWNSGWRRIWISVSVLWLVAAAVFASQIYDWSSAASIKQAFRADLSRLVKADLRALGCTELKGVLLAYGLYDIDPTVPAPTAVHDAQWDSLSWSRGRFKGRVSPGGAQMVIDQWAPKLLERIECSPRGPSADQFAAIVAARIHSASDHADVVYARSVSNPKNYLTILAAAFGVPLALLIGGFCIAWIRAGFQESTRT